MYYTCYLDKEGVVARPCEDLSVASPEGEEPALSCSKEGLGDPGALRQQGSEGNLKGYEGAQCKDELSTTF